MDTVNFKFALTPSDDQCPMSAEVWLDNDLLWSATDLRQPVIFSHDFSDNDSEHCLQIVLGGKTAEHTVIDDAGNILKDATVQISNVVIDELDVNQLFLDKCIYTHDFNGTQSEIQDTFHGIAGCNGTISFEFTTPIYLWLLENM